MFTMKIGVNFQALPFLVFISLKYFSHFMMPAVSDSIVICVDIVYIVSREILEK